MVPETHIKISSIVKPPNFIDPGPAGTPHELYRLDQTGGAAGFSRISVICPLPSVSSSRRSCAHTWFNLHHEPPHVPVKY